LTGKAHNRASPCLLRLSGGLQHEETMMFEEEDTFAYHFPSNIDSNVASPTSIAAKPCFYGLFFVQRLYIC